MVKTLITRKKLQTQKKQISPRRTNPTGNEPRTDLLENQVDKIESQVQNIHEGLHTDSSLIHEILDELENISQKINP